MPTRLFQAPNVLCLVVLLGSTNLGATSLDAQIGGSPSNNVYVLCRSVCALGRKVWRLQIGISRASPSLRHSMKGWIPFLQMQTHATVNLLKGDWPNQSLDNQTDLISWKSSTECFDILCEHMQLMHKVLYCT